ncbi:hypothetical protein I3843_01G089600 [Carya illinoinensis]|nr:hypothetical protein I3843_01G089600 [Carya illinoinensis]
MEGTTQAPSQSAPCIFTLQALIHTEINHASSRQSSSYGKHPTCTSWKLRFTRASFQDCCNRACPCFLSLLGHTATASMSQ